jgi:hypothetical protein
MSGGAVKVTIQWRAVKVTIQWRAVEGCESHVFYPRIVSNAA